MFYICNCQAVRNILNWIDNDTWLYWLGKFYCQPLKCIMALLTMVDPIQGKANQRSGLNCLRHFEMFRSLEGNLSYSDFTYRYVWNLFTGAYNFMVAFCVFRQQDFTFPKSTVIKNSIVIQQMVSKVSCIWFWTLLFYIENHAILDHAITRLHTIVQDMTSRINVSDKCWKYHELHFGLGGITLDWFVW